MKKALAILLVLVLVLGCTTAFAAKTDTQAAKPEKSEVRSLFGNPQDLIMNKIPDTPNQKSQTHNLWEPTKRD